MQSWVSILKFLGSNAGGGGLIGAISPAIRCTVWQSQYSCVEQVLLSCFRFQIHCCLCEERAENDLAYHN